ncbi:hypothetical protein ACFU5O_27965 [Streptomyces sp. NPDC057445]|uniref:hypothetical protein n=1 Tax=Streptomyces sp. NPDC057445 TaxID=3346136 RepID=UPI0036B21C21
MDLESVIDELYGLRPAAFVAARDERAAQARRSGDRSLAERIRALRRPTLAAWTSNLLVRRQPEVAERLVKLGAELRQAHHDLDRDQLRSLSSQQHAVISALARQARHLAAEVGQPVSDEAQHEVEATLHAVLADPQAAAEWAAGRLTRPLTAPFGFSADKTPRTRAAAPSQAQPTGQRGETSDKRSHNRQLREQIDQARKTAEKAEEAAHTSEEQLKVAEAHRQRAEQEARESEQRTADLAQQLREAETTYREAQNRARAAREQVTNAERVAREARHHASVAAHAAEQLEDGSSSPGAVRDLPKGQTAAKTTAPTK